jgi:hypothetical protein
MPNKVIGSTDYLTVAGVAGSETYQCPNTATYIAADTDYIWFQKDGTQRTVLTTELISYDLQRTPVKYANSSPYAIAGIIILKAGEVLDANELNQLIKNFELSIWFTGTLNTYGKLKGNRTSDVSYSPAVLLSDANKVAWYNPRDALGAVRAESGEENIYWDMLVGGNTISETVLSSGQSVANQVYIIVACTDNFFFTGCKIGDIYICSTPLTLTGSNKLRKYIGNHLANGVAGTLPVNGVYDGADDRLRTAPFTLDQPTMIYFLFRQLSWTSTDVVFDGSNTDYGALKQTTATPRLNVSAGTNGSSVDQLPVNQWGIIRVLFNGANSKFIIDDNDPLVGNFGTNKMGGFTIASRGIVSGGRMSNIEFAEAILANAADTEITESRIYNYLIYKKSLL